MRKWLLVVFLILGFYLDNTFFNLINLYGIRPDIELAMIVSLGVLIGSGPAGAIGFGLGLLADIFFNKIVGLTALTYMLTGVFAGFFYRKFYADNIIIPTVTAAIAAFLKAHVFFIAALIAGAKPSYLLTLAAHILPCALLTGGAGTLIHLIFKKALFRPLWRQAALKLEKE